MVQVLLLVAGPSSAAGIAPIMGDAPDIDTFENVPGRLDSSGECWPAFAAIVLSTLASPACLVCSRQQAHHHSQCPPPPSHAGATAAPLLSDLLKGANKRSIEDCTRKCVPTCVRGGEGAAAQAGEGWGACVGVEWVAADRWPLHLATHSMGLPV